MKEHYDLEYWRRLIVNRKENGEEISEEACNFTKNIRKARFYLSLLSSK